ncbi:MULTISPECIES: lipopolysaccharide biosynthesis protein [unclassified Nocardioides]|uniref:lipopolysaccharide biosynthesis protein n=1 Tax=unclassified Nocardioides TaxID=2615069 RepID=UPI0006FAB326|nr:MULTISPECIES: oligosaccharide flippase family protein [unclassified Nocardioides]
MTSFRANVATLAGANAVAQGTTLLTLPILSRVYAPSDFGLLAAYLALAALLAVLATLRYELAIPLATDDDDAEALSQATRRIVLIASALTLVVTLAVAAAHREGLIGLDCPVWFLTLGLFVLLAGEASILNYGFTRTASFRAQGISRIVQAITTAAAQIILSTTLLASAGGLILGALIGQLSCVVALRISRDQRGSRTAPSTASRRSVLRRYRRMPLLNGPNALADAARTNGINLLIGNHSYDTLGQFAMAMRVVQAPVGILASAIAQVSYQRMATAAAGELRGMVLQSVQRALAVGAIPFAVLFLVAPTLVPAVLGPSWTDAGTYAQILTPWLYLNLATSPISMVYLVTERQGTLLTFSLVYMVAPMVCLVLLGTNLTHAVVAMSAVMTVLLVFFVFLAVSVAAAHDRSSDPVVPAT